MRSVLYGLLLGFSIATAANAQTASLGNLATGTYTGQVQEKGKPGPAGVDIWVREVLPDGRLNGTVREHRAGPMCGMALPMNGILLKDNEVRMEVNDGAPEGCERTYLLTRMPDGQLVGTEVRGKNKHPITFVAKR